MITLLISTKAILNLVCYGLGLVIGAYFCKYIELQKKMNTSNKVGFYFVYVVLTCVIGFIIGEFLFRLITMFM